MNGDYMGAKDNTTQKATTNASNCEKHQYTRTHAYSNKQTGAHSHETKPFCTHLSLYIYIFVL